MFSRIMYVTVFVSDQDKALDFYTSNFGFQKRSDYNGNTGTLTATPSVFVCAHQKRPPRRLGMANARVAL